MLHDPAVAITTAVIRFRIQCRALTSLEHYRMNLCEVIIVHTGDYYLHIGVGITHRVSLWKWREVACLP